MGNVEELWKLVEIKHKSAWDFVRTSTTATRLMGFSHAVAREVGNEFIQSFQFSLEFLS